MDKIDNYGIKALLALNVFATMYSGCDAKTEHGIKNLDNSVEMVEQKIGDQNSILEEIRRNTGKQPDFSRCDPLRLTGETIYCERWENGYKCKIGSIHY